ncbi:MULTISPECIES: Ger(x)C family spore germination protein [Solibacillus]|uniref:Ger(x)C family spore germination protein n=1 Tax=Solibacillus TaxID=648800 RepID=UPI00203B3591|nr:Ger(x)C family spore germination protein [Solibacillus isronensis]MCM3721304.1 Ger(x)C family spore germination protein [Solibacillus isronensis]
MKSLPRKIKGTILLFVVLGSVLLSGCAFKDIDKSVFVAMIALDVSDDEEKPYKVTLKLYEPTGSFNEATEPQYSYLSENGETLSEAIRMMESYSDKELEFGHSKLIILGEELVKDNKNKEILDFLLRRPDIQMISWIAVGRPNAEEIIKMIPQGESAAYPELFNYFDSNGTTTPYIVTTHLFEFRRNIKESGIDSVLPIIEINQEDQHFEVNKSLLLALNKEPLELDSLDTSIYNMLSRSVKHANLLIKEDGDHFIANIDTVKSKYHVDIKNPSEIQLAINISLYGSIAESHKPMINKDLPRYNEELKKESEEKFTAFITKMKKNGYDPLGFGIDYKAKVLHNRRMTDEEWMEAYKKAKVNLTVKPGIKSTGSIQ